MYDFLEYNQQNPVHKLSQPPHSLTTRSLTLPQTLRYLILKVLIRISRDLLQLIFQSLYTFSLPNKLPIQTLEKLIPVRKDIHITSIIINKQDFQTNQLVVDFQKVFQTFFEIIRIIFQQHF